MRGTGDLERPVFSLVVLVDPPKDVVVGFEPGDAIARRARVVVTDRATRRTHEGIVDLGTGDLESWRVLDGVLPPIVDEDFERAAEAALADPRFVEALRRRGIEDLSIVQVDPLSAGSFPQNPAGRRIVWATPYLKPHPLANAYSSPIEHLRASVDLDTGEVVDVLDHDPIVPISTADGDYETEEAVGGWRDDIAPLDIVQPDGPGFTLDGHVLRWQDWRLHVALHPVDGPRPVRPALPRRRARTARSCTGRASARWSSRTATRTTASTGARTSTRASTAWAGSANSLQLGCDCLGEIRYVDAVLADGAGAPREIPNAICIHEEDAGVLWKHTRALVRDGARAPLAQARGVVLRHGRQLRLRLLLVAVPGRHDRAGGEADRHRPHARRDARAGARQRDRASRPTSRRRTTSTCSTCGSTWRSTASRTRSTRSTSSGPTRARRTRTGRRSSPARRRSGSESEGRRHIDPAAARSWKVVNPGRTNHVGEPTGYKLQPFNGPTMLAGPESSVGRRAGFAHANLWVTRFDPDELHAAGEHPNQHPGGAGLPEWIAKDRPLEEADVVLWHTFGVSHAVRTEDWPVMPVERVGFALRPVGFFARNPAMRVPPSEAKGHHCA